MAKHADAVASYTLRAKVESEGAHPSRRGRDPLEERERRAASELFLHLYLNGFKNEKTVFMRVPVSASAGAGRPPSWGWIQGHQVLRARDGGRRLDARREALADDPDDETDIRVPLPRAVEPGASITIDVGLGREAPDGAVPDRLRRVVPTCSASGFRRSPGARKTGPGPFYVRPAHRVLLRLRTLTTCRSTCRRASRSAGAEGRAREEEKGQGRPPLRAGRRARFLVHDLGQVHRTERRARRDSRSGRCSRPGHDHVAEVEVNAVKFALDQPREGVWAVIRTII